MARRGVTLSPRQRADWLRLIRTEQVGPRTFRALINQFGGAAAALEALPTLARKGGRLIPPRVPTLAEAEDEIAALARIGGRLVAMGEADYPHPLQEIDDAPPLLCVRGFARDLGAAGYAIVSGLARGIDAAAHEASLASGTIGVFAGGLARPYPPENLKLIEAVAEQGALVSEMPLNWEPRARDFPRRNRLVSGMALGVVVVEAAERSGSLITARLAAEQGREVFAIPGSPLDPRAGGTNALLKRGATLVTCADDVVEALTPLFAHLPAQDLEAPTAPTEPSPPDDTVRARIAELLGPVPTPMDDLVRFSGASVSDVQWVLLELDLAGRLERHGGGLVSLR
ncbi:MAG: DNA processing protein DprA [Rhizobiales bacterium 39-66-18]|nr:MAG: DNA processing protein DprA [Rhizobiales bacterium 39-66-18]